MDQWLDNVFDPILDGDLDELSDGRSLENRMRGGGEGVPGLSQVGREYLTDHPTSAECMENVLGAKIIRTVNITRILPAIYQHMRSLCVCVR